jgi:hypothetical protein
VEKQNKKYNIMVEVHDLDIEYDENGVAFECPVTGQVILEEEGFYPSEATVFAWVDICGCFEAGSDEIEERYEELAEENWGEYEENFTKLAEEFGCDSLYILTEYGMACGPCSTTLFIGIKNV